MTEHTVDEHFFVPRLSAQALDTLWAHGWRHFGQYFFRYSHLTQDQQHYHVLPLRIDLRAFALKRRQKRVLKRNQDLRVSVQAAYVTPQVEALFERHKTRFKSNIPSSIFTFVSPHPATIPCKCLSISVHKENKLLGISYLDVGEQATSSVYQCYDPDERTRSLGIFMMLCAISYNLRYDKPYYYHGYAYKEASHYDYKKHFQAVEAYDWQGNWLPYNKSSC